jgi:hypothetical protein
MRDIEEADNEVVSGNINRAAKEEADREKNNGWQPPVYFTRGGWQPD